MTVALVVTCYERTYRQVLRAGYFRAIERQNDRVFDERVALLNNVDEPALAIQRAEHLLSTGELTSYRLVDDLLLRARRHTDVPDRYFRKRPYLFNYGLVMPHAVSSEWIVGWDAEAELIREGDWVTAAQKVMTGNPSILTANPNWTPVAGHGGLSSEAVARTDGFVLNWGFSDQVFLIRTADFLQVDWRTFALAAYVRHAPHPYTFEYRMECYQRAVQRYRATLESQSYHTRTLTSAGVLDRTGGAPWEYFRMRVLHKIDHHILRRFPPQLGPRLVKAGYARRGVPRS